MGNVNDVNVLGTLGGESGPQRRDKDKDQHD